MAIRIRTCRDREEARAAVYGIMHYVGVRPDDAMMDRWSTVMPSERMHAAFDGREIVGGAGAFEFALTAPGRRSVSCAGVTVVGVLPTHRRRGVLTSLMRTELAAIREWGNPIAALYASEEPIYGRFGYGMGCVSGQVDIPCADSRFILPLDRRGSMRLVSLEEAPALIRPVYERYRRGTPGALTRTSAWWRARQMRDDPASRDGAGEKNVAVLDLDGRVSGYAIYRLKPDWTQSHPKGKVIVSEAIGDSLEAQALVWRYLFDTDWTETAEAWNLPLDHALFHLLAYPRRMQFRVVDGVWLRLVDVGAALSGRGYGGDGRATLEVVSDPIFADNIGTWTVTDGVAKRSGRRPDVRLDIQALGQVFLNGFTFTELARAGRVEEGVRGGLRRADALFATSDPYPWCPEIF